MIKSRLKTQQNKILLKQSLFFFTSGFIVIAFFIIAIIPLFMRVLSATNNQPLPTAKPGAGPIAPFLNLPFDATNSAQVSLTGQGSPATDAFLIENGNEIAQSKSDANGAFIFSDVTLQKGDNTFQAVIQNSQHVRSNPSTTIHILYSSNAPKLDITTPADGSTITERKQQVTSITGTTDLGNKITLNDQFIFVNSDGSFTATYQLQQGDNTLHLKAIDGAGNETDKDLTLHYLP